MQLNRITTTAASITLAVAMLNWAVLPVNAFGPAKKKNAPADAKIEMPVEDAKVPAAPAETTVADPKPQQIAAASEAPAAKSDASLSTPNDELPVQPDILSDQPQPRLKLASVDGPITKPQNDAELDSSIVLKTGLKMFKDDIDLTVDKAEIVNLKVPVSRVAISQSEIAKVVIISPTQLQLLGKKIGAANLILWPNARSSEYTTIDIIVHRDVSALAKQLQVIDPSISVVPLAAENSIILTGHADSMEVSQMAAQLAKAFLENDINRNVQMNPNGNNVSSQAPGSATPVPMPNVINLIQVKGRPSTKLEMARQKLLNIDPNIQLEIVPGADGSEKAVLTGRVSNPNMISEAINTTSLFYGQPGVKVVTGPGGNLVRSSGDGNFHSANAFSDNKDTNVLQGSVVTDSTGNVISMLKLTKKPQVKCTIRFLDISRKDATQLGATLTGQANKYSYGHFNGAQSALRPFSDLVSGTLNGTRSASGWLDTTNGNLAGAAVSNLFGAGTTQVLTLGQDMAIALSAFVEKRKIRTLAEPTLTMLSGEKASFLAGGELPIPVVGGNGQITITYKEFGIRLNIVPTITEDNKINMQVAPEVSALDPSNSFVANGISVPAIKSRRMQTTLEVKNNQPFILAGLFNQEDMDMASKFPGLGSIPVVGALFRQKNSEHLNNEMMVIITPEIVFEPTEAVALSDEAKKAISDAEGKRSKTQASQ